MNIEALKSERIQDFIDYCKKHRMELDDSFLYDEDLRDFKLDKENPTYIVTNDQGDIKATASLIIDNYHRRGRRGRFRIFHSEVNDEIYYRILLQEILKHTDGLDKIFIFIPIVNEKLIDAFIGLKFNVERYSFLLLREDIDVSKSNLPEDYAIKPFRECIDEEAWCEVRNAGFSKLQGSETPMTPEGVKNMMTSEDNIDGGAMILYHKDRPVGVVRCSDDEYEDAPIMNIGPLAIIPEYQGKGLGRILLRTALNFAKKKSYTRTILSVNAENERAKALYIQEGFKQIEAVVCYKYEL